MAKALVKDLNKSYENANDQHIGAITIYGDTSTNKAYADAAKSVEMTASMKTYICYMAQMGRVAVSMNSKLYIPVEVDPINGKLSIVTVTGSGTLTVTPLVLALA